MFDNNGSLIFPKDGYLKHFLVILASYFGKFLFKTIINHTVHAHVDDFKKVPIVLRKNKFEEKFLQQIIEKQKQNPRYDYASHEQIEIDRLVYEAYGLNEDDIQEVENWYVRRYPKLAAAQKANLEAKQKAEIK